VDYVCRVDLSLKMVTTVSSHGRVNGCFHNTLRVTQNKGPASAPSPMIYWPMPWPVRRFPVEFIKFRPRKFSHHKSQGWDHSKTLAQRGSSFSRLCSEASTLSISPDCLTITVKISCTSRIVDSLLRFIIF
jgi:hypothetical protein